MIIPGGVTDRSARLMVSNWPSSNVKIGANPRLPADARVRVRKAPVLTGEACRLMVDIDGLAPDTLYRIGVDVSSSSLSPLEIRDPVAIRTAPEAFEAGKKTLLATASCYFPSDHFRGNPALVGACLRARARKDCEARPCASSTPTAFFLTGDQIYADVPWRRNAGHLSTFRGRYREAWSNSRMGQLLRTGGTFFVPDDHEYWNNFPESVPWLPASWSGSWQQSAWNGMQAFWAYQGVWNFPPGFTGSTIPGDWWAQGDIGELPVFLSDIRVRRTSTDGKRCPNRGTCVSPNGFASTGQMQALVSWLGGLSKVGLLVIGQPLLHTGGYTDRAVADYERQFTTLMTAVRGVLTRGANLVVIAGDIHWGRLTILDVGPGRMIEFVSSPTARIAKRSIFGTRWSVGGPKDTNWKWYLQHSGPVRKVLRPSGVQRVFATGENNFGVLEIEKSLNGGLGLTFELWDITAKRLAVNGWKGPGRPDICIRRVVV